MTTTHPHHCGSVVLAATRLLLAGDPDAATQLVAELDHHEAVHAACVAVSLAADLIRCMDHGDEGHGTAHLRGLGLALAAEPAP